ncbi:DUF4913 domain-containing protein [Curtobacterium sp. MCJR17_020]|uniref:DUF4913 domain-containing protein n=1 Tax=Curtobacterium sp. MCJR17_020 TaxID=2175619 RepID=UPI000DA94AFA|nr:DUF4913 domain-containing protein [Curtobacterium sp. MCJR17_020]WIE74180.1 DUF4913 domain-containing protein [Curtobacterium sp. MCJR17_020]
MEGFDESEPEAAGATPGLAIEPVYESVYEFVDGFVRPMFRRNPKRYLWAENWFDYPEVLDRFEAMWRAWEWDRLPEQAGMTGMAAFWKDTFDPLMDVITSEDGPFWRLSTDKYKSSHADVPEMFPAQHP